MIYYQMDRNNDQFLYCPWMIELLSKENIEIAFLSGLKQQLPFLNSKLESVESLGEKVYYIMCLMVLR